MAQTALPVYYSTSQWAPFEQSDDYIQQDTLPKDPRQWTREHVAEWLNFIKNQHNLPPIPLTRFLMNGKALCLMSPQMFLDRVPLGGKLLYKDFRLRLCAALYSKSKLIN